MFRASQHPSSGALKTVTATSGIGHNTGTGTSFQRGRLRTVRFLRIVFFLIWTRGASSWVTSLGSDFAVSGPMPV